MFWHFWQINARAHLLGKEYQILNDKFKQQYSTFLQNLHWKPQLDTTDFMAATYYLLLQDRVDSANNIFQNSLKRKRTETADVRISFDTFDTLTRFSWHLLQISNSCQMDSSALPPNFKKIICKHTLTFTVTNPQLLQQSLKNIKIIPCWNGRNDF